MELRALNDFLAIAREENITREAEQLHVTPPMTAYEIISIFIGILALLMSFGSLVIALLAFLDKRNKRK